MKYIFLVFLPVLLLSCRQGEKLVQPQPPVVSSKTDTIVATKIKAIEYHWDEHSDFNTFYSDFKIAINAGDKAAVLKMMDIPFMCHSIECGALERESGKTYDKSKDFSIKNEAEFYAKYPILFSERRIADINKGVLLFVENINSEHEDMRELWSEGEYVLECYNELMGNLDAYFFSFMPDEKGMYKLHNIPYKP